MRFNQQLPPAEQPTPFCNVRNISCSRIVRLSSAASRHRRSL